MSQQKESYQQYQQSTKKHVAGRWVIAIISIIFVVAIAGLVIYYSQPHSPLIKEKLDGTKIVDVAKITEDKAFVDYQGQQYRDGEIETVFDYDGFYKGRYFRESYINSENKVMMRESPDMKPDDGIIEGFVVEKIKDGNATIYIFLDEDWKKQMNITNIFWGVQYENAQEFSFTNQISEGVYMQSVPDSVGRLGKDYKVHLGGIIVGDLTREDDVDKTLIRFI